MRPLRPGGGEADEAEGGVTKQDLTEVEAETLRAVVTLQSNLGYSPCYREIAAVRKKAVGTIKEGLHRLRKKGWVDFVDGKPRTIRVL